MGAHDAYTYASLVGKGCTCLELGTHKSVIILISFLRAHGIYSGIINCYTKLVPPPLRVCYSNDSRLE